MALELQENHEKVTLDTIRRLYRRNSRVTLYKLIQKTHPTGDSSRSVYFYFYECCLCDGIYPFHYTGKIRC